MKAKTLRIVLPMLTAVLLLGGCGQANTTQQDILDMLNASDTITIELTVEKDENEGYKYSVNWIQLGDMTSSKELRAVMDEQFKITGNTGNKNGMFYVNEKGENTQNNTLSVALRNRVFTTILNNADDLESINYTLAGNYSDIDIEDERAIYAAISDYFELLNAGENGESNIEDSLSRAEAMSLVFRAVTPVSEIEENSAFDSAVGQSDYNAFANKENTNVFVSTADGSLNETTYTQNMTKAEYIYLVMNEVFGNQAVQSVDANTKIDGLTSAGDLRADKQLSGKQQLSSAIIKEFVSNPSKIDESLYKAIVFANEKGISNTENMDSAITKGDAVEILCKALMQNTSIEEFNYNMGSVDTGYEYIEPTETTETEEISGNGTGDIYEPTEEDTQVEDEAAQAIEEAQQADEQLQSEPEQTTSEESNYTITPMTTQTMYAQQAVNLRQGPGTEYDKVGSLSTNQSVEITGYVETSNGQWYQLSDGDFVSSKYLKDTKVSTTTTTNNTKPSTNTNSNSNSTGGTNNNTSQPTQSSGEQTVTGVTGDGSGSSRGNRGNSGANSGTVGGGNLQ